MQSKPTAVLLAIIAVLLAVNLVVNLPPQVATAQPMTHLKAAAPHVIQVEPSLSGHIFRLWSDGVIEEAVFDGLSAACLPNDGAGPIGSGWQVMPETVPLPPGVRITRIYAGGYATVLLRLRSDGVVEENVLKMGEVWCGWRTPPE